MVFRDLLKTNRNVLFNLVKFLQLEMHSSSKFKLGQDTSLGDYNHHSLIRAY